MTARLDNENRILFPVYHTGGRQVKEEASDHATSVAGGGGLGEGTEPGDVPAQNEGVDLVRPLVGVQRLEI